jgi:hypothetical protein
MQTHRRTLLMGADAIAAVEAGIAVDASEPAAWR